MEKGLRGAGEEAGTPEAAAAVVKVNRDGSSEQGGSEQGRWEKRSGFGGIQKPSYRVCSLGTQSRYGAVGGAGEPRRHEGSGPEEQMDDRGRALLWFPLLPSPGRTGQQRARDQC